MKQQLALVSFLIFYSLNLWGFCLQSFNGYGPAYATNTYNRTVAFTKEIAQEPRCSLVNLQEVWNKSQIDLVDRQLQAFYEVLAPNREQRIGLMTMISGQVLEQKLYLFKLNNEDGLLDSFRELFGVRKAFHVSLLRISGEAETLYLVNTHLHPSSQPVRLAQIMDIFEWRLQHPDNKVILSGDFNSEVSSLERVFMMYLLGAHDAMAEVLGQYPKDFCTYCDTNPRSWLSGKHVFDYVFYSNISLTSSDLVAVDGQINLMGNKEDVYSDHYGLRVEFAWQKSQEISEEELGQRISYFLKVIDVADKALKTSGNKKFNPYRQRLSDLRLQLLNQQGLFWDYFRFFR